MPEYYQNNNGDNKKSVSTSGEVYTNGKSAKPSALQVTYYDDSVRLSFVPELPEEEKTERRRYDYKNPIMTALYRNKCHEFYNAYKTEIVPAIAEGRSEQISIQLAQVNMLILDTNIDSEGAPRPILKLVKNIDLGTGIAKEEDVITYEFNTGEYFLGYNEATGEFKKKVITYNELELFMKDLDNSINATSNTFVHTDRVVNRYWKDTIDQKIMKIGYKVGADMGSKPQYSTGNGGQGSIFNAPSNHNSNNVTYENITVSDLDALESQIMN